MPDFKDGGPESRKFIEEESTEGFNKKKKVDRCPSDDADKYKQGDWDQSFTDRISPN